MSFKDILVHLDTSPAGGPICEFAVSLAAAFGAHLTAAGVVLEAMPVSAATGMGDDVPFETLREIADEARAATAEAFARLRATAPATLDSEMVMIDAFPGEARDQFAQLARHYDLTVVGQGGPDGGPDDALMGEGALMGSGRPIFMVPYIHRGPVRLDTVMIAWDGGPLAARAVADALPLLKKAKRVTVVQIGAPGKAETLNPAFDITRHLSRHGVEASFKTIPSSNDIGAALLSCAADLSADYLVMGGYGHSKLREFVFGGVTRSMFKSQTLPVFMSH